MMSYGAKIWKWKWKCLLLIGGGHQVNDQYYPATGKARAFRNGITLDGQP